MDRYLIIPARPPAQFLLRYDLAHSGGLYRTAAIPASFRLLRRSLRSFRCSPPILLPSQSHHQLCRHTCLQHELLCFTLRSRWSRSPAGGVPRRAFRRAGDPGCRLRAGAGVLGELHALRAQGPETGRVRAPRRAGPPARLHSHARRWCALRVRSRRGLVNCAVKCKQR